MNNLKNWEVTVYHTETRSFVVPITAATEEAAIEIAESYSAEQLEAECESSGLEYSDISAEYWEEIVGESDYVYSYAN